jgi:hypothetical protein
VRNERQADAKRRLAVREQRLRNTPTVDDIQSGDALLVDVSDRTVAESVWRRAKVPLPDSLAIPRIASLLRRGLEELRNQLKTKE